MLKTLENIAAALREKGVSESEIDDTMHSASLLAFVKASHTVVNKTTAPTMLYRITYDEQTQNVEFKLLKGRALAPNNDPNKKSLDISLLDMLIAALLREKMPLLLEGKTGIGKTYTVEQFFKTILPKENYCGIRLNPNMTNVLQPYTEGQLENGMYKIRLRKDSLDRIAAIFIDEANRGDTNQIMQLIDGKLTLGSGESGEIGIPIPEYENEKVVVNADNKRPTFVVLAQNPSMTKDPKYTGARRGDAAQNNRCLEIDIPNSASTIGATPLLLETGNGQHSQFINEYKKHLSKYLGIDISVLSTLDNSTIDNNTQDNTTEWMSVFAYTANPTRTSCPNTYSSIELLDCVELLASKNLREEFENDTQATKDWSNLLTKYGVDFTYDPTLTDTAVVMEKIRKITESFAEELVTRDTTKAKKLADAVSTARRLKQAFKAKDPVDYFKNTVDYTTVQDIACGLAIVLNDKQDKHEVDPITLLDDVLKEYVGIVEGIGKAVMYHDEAGQAKRFNANDTAMSAYFLVTNKALQEIERRDPKKTSCIAAFISSLNASAADLKRMQSGVEQRKPILARMISDIATLAGFADQYSAELEQGFMAVNNASQRRAVLKSIYRSVKEDPSAERVYLQRLTRVLGV